MNRLVRAELVKLRTTRTLSAHLLGVLALVALGVSGSIATAGHDGNAALGSADGLRSVFGGSVNAGFLALTMGIIVSAGEYRHNTITATLLVDPRRRRLVVAKTVAMSLVGMVMAALACVLTVAIAWPWLSAKGVHPDFFSSDVGLVLAGSAMVIVLFALIGVGIGAIVRNQVAAIVGVLMWLLVVEQLLVKLFPTIGKWLSYGASGSLIGSVDPTLLPMGAAAVLLLGYAAVFVAGGVRATARRDIAA